MDMKCVCLLSLLLTHVQGKNRAHRTVKLLPIISTAVEIVDAIYDIVTPEPRLVSPKDLRITKREIISSFSDKLDVVQAQLYGTIRETLSLSKIDEINYRVQSVLLDLRDYLLVNGSERITKKDEFETQAALRIADIRSLPSRLKKSLTTAELSLLELMAANSKCNMTGINEFKNFYLNLTETAIIVHLSYKKLKQNSSLKAESEWWNGKLLQMTKSFENEDKACKNKFLSLLEGDLKTIDNAEELSTNVHQKYIWYIIDIFILQQNGDGEEIYIDGNSSTMLTLGVNGLRKYALYIDKQTRFNTIKCLLLKTNARSHSVDAFILDIDTPVPGYVSTIEGSSKKTTFFYDETDSSKSCHPTTIPNIVIMNQVEIEPIDGLETGAIVGIAIGSVTGFIALVAVFCWCCRRNKWRYRQP